MRRFILAAALAAASASFALAPALADDGPNPAGVDDLGVNISGVTLTRPAVSAYLQSLTPEARKDVEAACANYNHAPMGVDEQTLAFCKLA